MIEVRQQGLDSHNSIYKLETKALQTMAERLLAKETLGAITENVDMDAYDQQVFRKYARPDGSLKTLPAQEKKFQAILRYAAQSFDEKKRYSEKDVNRILKRLHADTASLRRGFIEYKLMKRDNGVYWKI